MTNYALTLTNIKTLGPDQDEQLRLECNGEEYKDYQLNCDSCGADEEDVNDLFVFKVTEDSEFLFCDRCLSQMKSVLKEIA